MKSVSNSLLHTSVCDTESFTGMNVTRLNLSTVEDEITKPEFAYPSGAYKGDESHGGEDVPIYAIGPWSHLFQSQHEQTYIAYVMSYAACIGPLKDLCKDREQLVKDVKEQPKTAVFVQGIRPLPSLWFFLFIGTILIVFYCTTTGSRKRNEDYNEMV